MSRKCVCPSCSHHGSCNHKHSPHDDQCSNYKHGTHDDHCSDHKCADVQPTHDLPNTAMSPIEFVGMDLA